MVPHDERGDDHPRVATSSPTPTAKPPTPGKTRMNASDIPPMRSRERTSARA